jgi:hypothetical protein
MVSYHYSLNGAVLKITCSDSQQTHVDEDRIPDVHNHPDGRKRQHIQQFNDSHLSKEWRKKLGKELAIKFLLKHDNGMYLIFLSCKLLLLLPSLVDYILAKFPKSYKLYADEIGDNHEIDRSDAYLYSMCSFLFVSYLLLTLSFPHR